jgi:hypothetical protein
VRKGGGGRDALRRVVLEHAGQQVVARRVQPGHHLLHRARRVHGEVRLVLRQLRNARKHGLVRRAQHPASGRQEPSPSRDRRAGRT